MLDNSTLIAEFAPEHADGDTFIYTEILDRGKRKGNNGVRLVKTFYHRSRDEFWDQWPTIKRLCDLTKTRACTRLAPRSCKKVGKTFTQLVVDAALTGNWVGMKSLYNRACGTTGPNQKLWLFDIDVVDRRTLALGQFLFDQGKLRASIPSKKGLHYIFEPLDMRLISAKVAELGLSSEEACVHKDNPTNLYIPDGAD